MPTEWGGHRGGQHHVRLRRPLRAIQHDWTALGLDVQIDVLPSSVLRERVAQGEVAVFYKSWLADHPDAENFGLVREGQFSPGLPTTRTTTTLSLKPCTGRR